MKNSILYIIDTNVLIQYPEVLARARENIVIPQSVLDELRRSQIVAGRYEFRKAISSAIHRGVRIGRLRRESVDEGGAIKDVIDELNNVDLDIVALAEEYIQTRGAASVFVVTGDSDLRKYLSIKNIQSLTGPQFLKTKLPGSIDEEILKVVKSALFKQMRSLAIRSIFGIAVSVFGYLVFSHYRIILRFPLANIVGLAGLGIALYWYRQHQRFSYGVFEFAVGVIMSFIVFFPKFDIEQLSPTSTLQVLSGLYVMVRGLDNMRKGCEGTWLQSIWSRLF